MRRIAGAVVAMAALLGCRTIDAGPPPTEPRVVAPERRDVGASEAAREDDEVGRAPEGAVALPVEPPPVEPPPVEPPPVEPPPVEPPQAVVPIALPFPAQALVIRPVVDHGPVVLFPDEAAAVRRRVAKSLVARGYEVVPVAELERIEAAAAEGRLVLEGDQVCRAPLLPAELTARYFAGRPFVSLEAACYFPPCGLQVTVQDPARPEAYREYTSRVARPHDPKAWVAAAAKLRVANEVYGGIVGGLSGSSHPPPVRFEFPWGIGPWGKSPIDSISFGATQQHAAGCAHPDAALGFRTELRASVDAHGDVSRCMATSEHTQARPADGACLCNALERLEIPAGPPGRRFRVTAVDEGGFRGAGLRLELVQPGTEPWLRRLDEAPALARCMNAELPPKLDARVTLALAPDGGVTDVRVDGDITTPPAIALAQCLVKELRLVPLPCRPPGIDRLQLRLVVGAP